MEHLGVGLALLEQDNVGIADADDKVLLLFREEGLDYVDRGDVNPVRQPEQDGDALNVAQKAQLLGALVNVRRQDVVQNNIL